MIDYEFKIQNFSGPLDKLLELIEEKKLEITRLSLAAITTDFLEYVRRLQSIDPRLLSDFISVAAKLILLKSKSLLPEIELTEEEEQDIEDLERRLKIYKEFKSAAKYLKELISEGRRSFSRELFAGLKGQTVFYPPPSLTAELLRQSLEELYAVVSANHLEEVEKKMISFEYYIGLLLERLKSGRSKFSELREGREKSEVIGLFLALLYLLHDKLVQIRQEGRFSDILIISSDV